LGSDDITRTTTLQTYLTQALHGTVCALIYKHDDCPRLKLSTFIPGN